MGDKSRTSRKGGATSTGGKTVKSASKDPDRLASKQRTFCKSVIREMLSDENSINFSRPVRELWDLADIPDYLEKIKRPMDLGTVQETLERKGYISPITKRFDPQLFTADVRLTFENAILYNGPGTPMHAIAKRFLSWFEVCMQDFPYGAEAQDPSAVAETQLSSSVPAVVSAPLDETETQTQVQKTTRPAKLKKNHDTPPPENAKILGTLPSAVDLQAELDFLRKERLQVRAELQNVVILDPSRPLTEEQRANLRDEVEQLPWERCKYVVSMLKSYVEEALAQINEPRPEFVDIDLSRVEPKLLVQIHEYMHPAETSKAKSLRAREAELEQQISNLESNLSNNQSSPKRRPKPKDKASDRERIKRRK